MLKLISSNASKTKPLGRNDVCHCGSGQKYKRCCLDKDEEKGRAERHLVKDFDSNKIRLELEQSLGKIAKRVEGKDLSFADLEKMLVGKTLDEINEDLDEGSSSLEQAQDLAYEAMETDECSKKIALAKRALKMHADCVDAWNILAEHCSTKEACLEHYKRAVEAGERTLGKDFFKDHEGHFWGLTESRPYMRAKHFMSQVLWDLGRHIEAMENYWHIIKLNPNDNLGVRYELFDRLLYFKDHAGIENLIKGYKDDCAASWQYDMALYLFQKHGPTSKRAIKQLIRALKNNEYVVGYLTSRRKLPKKLPNSYTLGSEDEAAIYVSDSRFAWDSTPESIRWLRSLT